MGGGNPAELSGAWTTTQVVEPRVTAEGRNVIPSHERGDSTSVCAGLCYVDGRPPAGDDLLTQDGKR